MRKISAFVCSIILTFSSLAGGQGASEEYQAHCRDLQQRMTDARTRMVQGVLPNEDPSRFLSSMSCLDGILKMKFNFGVFFNIDLILSRFMELITNRICGNAATSWNRMVDWVNTAVDVNVDLPWGVRSAGAPNPTNYGTPPTLPTGYGGEPAAAAGLWIYGQNRLSTGDLQDGQSVEATFTIPTGWSGVVEVGVSGQNLQAFIDGVEYLGPLFDMQPGVHRLRVTAFHLASGSVDLYHTPR